MKLSLLLGSAAAAACKFWSLGLISSLKLFEEVVEGAVMMNTFVVHATMTVLMLFVNQSVIENWMHVLKGVMEKVSTF